MCLEQSSHLPSKSVMKGVGPKIVAVTSPRPLIVQVQSLTQSQGSSQEVEHITDPSEIPYG